MAIKLLSHKLWEIGAYKKLVTRQERQVKWLYSNGNKCTKVVDAKLAMLLAQKLEDMQTMP